MDKQPPVTVQNTSHGDVTISSQDGGVRIAKGFFGRNFSCDEVRAFQQNLQEVCAQKGSECTRPNVKAADVAAGLCKMQPIEVAFKP
ncbi:MAG: hypothetical protein KDJ26_05825 [Alphaproteobacteria bacterium]|nr:hypothetical protein [Alphaproteobacteria bacterium]MCB9985069.1 hypothetical protein [Micavibrio sp.]